MSSIRASLQSVQICVIGGSNPVVTKTSSTGLLFWLGRIFCAARTIQNVCITDFKSSARFGVESVFHPWLKSACPSLRIAADFGVAHFITQFDNLRGARRNRR